MKIQFKVGKVEEDNISISLLSKTVKDLKEMLCDLQYSGTLQNTNSRQLDIHFDGALFSELSKNNWTLEKTPKLNMPNFSEGKGNPEVDLIISSEKLGGKKIVVEIEKGNKKTIWLDFIKMWMFMKAKKADYGLLICPVNYAHKHGEWNLFKEAKNIKKYLERFADVPKNKLNQIGIVGYTQMIKDGRKYKYWNKEEFKKIKKIT